VGKKVLDLRSIRLPYDIEYGGPFRRVSIRKSGYPDSIPVEEGEVQVLIEFEYDLRKEVGKIPEPCLIFLEMIPFRTHAVISVADIVHRGYRIWRWPVIKSPVHE
jgi:hypothetical protein